VSISPSSRRIALSSCPCSAVTPAGGVIRSSFVAASVAAVSTSVTRPLRSGYFFTLPSEVRAESSFSTAAVSAWPYASAEIGGDWPADVARPVGGFPSASPEGTHPPNESAATAISTAGPDLPPCRRVTGPASCLVPG
jgi:hypothetical protein